MKAKVLCVYDNGAVENTSFIGAQGLSMLIDADGRKTLFDTGMRGRYLLHNLSFMKIKPDEIDRIVISHNHKSNTGGLKAFAEARKEPIDVYVNDSFEGLRGFLGSKVSDEITSKLNFIHMTEDIELSEHLHVIGPFGAEKEFFPILRTRDGPAVFSSCYHCGLNEPLDYVKTKYRRNPYALIGGIHLPKAKQRTVDPVSDIISSYGVSKMYINHCATPRGIVYLRTRFGLHGVNDFFVGDSAEFNL